MIIKFSKKRFLTPGSMSSQRLITSLCQLLPGSVTTLRTRSLWDFRVSFRSNRSNQSRSLGRFFSGSLSRRNCLFYRECTYIFSDSHLFIPRFFCFYFRQAVCQVTVYGILFPFSGPLHACGGRKVSEPADLSAVTA